MPTRTGVKRGGEQGRRTGPLASNHHHGQASNELVRCRLSCRTDQCATRAPRPHTHAPACFGARAPRSGGDGDGHGEGAGWVGLDWEGAMSLTIRTPLTQQLGIKYPIFLAGMAAVRSHIPKHKSHCWGVGFILAVTWDDRLTHHVTFPSFPHPPRVPTLNLKQS